MNPFPSILVPLDGSSTAARSLGCATWLARRLGSRLHVLNAGPDPLPAREALTRLKVPEAAWPLVVLHQAPACPADAVLEAVAQYEVQLVVMTARGKTAEAQAAGDTTRLVGHVTHAVLERSPVPVLLLPPAYREELPWTRVLVPVSGEAEADAALTLAVRLARALDLGVHVVHVIPPGDGDADLAARARYADALHHEYPRQLEEVVSRALADCTPGERCRVEDVALGYGEVDTELLALIERKRVSLLVIGWHGCLASGRAPVLRRLIESVASPLLLVKPAEPQPFRLKVGEEIE
ncbi:MAG TPA: universal stress protein [Thermodesulfobacteriota bacterium]